MSKVLVVKGDSKEQQVKMVKLVFKVQLVILVNRV